MARRSPNWAAESVRIEARLPLMAKPYPERPERELTGSSPSGRSDVAARRRQLGDRAADDPRDLHLGDPDDLADLLLGHVLLEPQAQHVLLALVQPLEQAGDRRAVLGARQLWIEGAVRVGQRRVVVLAAPARRVQRRGAHALLSLQRLQDLLVFELDGLADLTHRRCAPQARGQLGAVLVDLQRALLQLAGRPNRPAAI